jgi:hypothetical protein
LLAYFAGPPLLDNPPDASSLNAGTTELVFAPVFRLAGVDSAAT